MSAKAPRRFPARFLLAVLALALLPGCSGTRHDLPWGGKPTTFFDKEDNTPIVELNYKAAERLAANMKKTLPPGSPVYVQAFANMGDPEDARPFGRIVADQVAARLAQEGFRVTEGTPQDPDKPLLASPGRYDPSPSNSTSSRDTPPREARLSGTYLLGKNVIYLSSKITRLDDKAVVAGFDWTLPNNKNTRELLPQLKASGLTPAVKTLPDPLAAPLPGERTIVTDPNGKKKK